LTHNGRRQHAGHHEGAHGCEGARGETGHAAHTVTAGAAVAQASAHTDQQPGQHDGPDRALERGEGVGEGGGQRQTGQHHADEETDSPVGITGLGRHEAAEDAADAGRAAVEGEQDGRSGADEHAATKGDEGFVQGDHGGPTGGSLKGLALSAFGPLPLLVVQCSAAIKG